MGNEWPASAMALPAPMCTGWSCRSIDKADTSFASLEDGPVPLQAQFVGRMRVATQVTWPIPSSLCGHPPARSAPTFTALVIVDLDVVVIVTRSDATQDEDEAGRFLSG